jgi:MOSC domain-containing protein
VRGGARPGNLLRNRMVTIQPAQIASIYRYPVKGLSPEPLPGVALSVGQTLPADRRYAIENGPSGFDPADPKWMAKAYFLMLMRDEWLAGLRSHFDDSSNVLSINHNGRIVAQGNLATPEGRAAIENFFATTFTGQIKGPPKVLESPGHSFSDVARKVISIINLASVRAIEDMVGAPVHPLRFRANLYVEGWPAWHEFDLVDRTLSIGDVRLKVVKRIVRCAAVNVDPDTAQRDLAIPQALQRRLGHGDCGIYAEVIEGGTISAGDTIAAEQPELL